MRAYLKVAAAASAAAGSLLLAACGGNVTSSTSTPAWSSSSAASSSSSSSSAASGGSSSGSSDTAALGKAAGTSAGVTTLPSETIGYVNYGATGQAAQREQVAMQAATKAIGWKLISCDGQNTPQTQTTCAANLMNQNINALVLNTIPQSTVTTTLQQAKAKGIPVVNIGGNAGQQNLETASYYPSDQAMGTALADWLIKKVGPAKTPILQQTLQATFVVNRNSALTSAIQGHSNLTIAAPFAADATNLVAGTQQQVSALLASNPSAKAVWITFSGAEVGAQEAIATKFPRATYPSAPLLLTFYANLPELSMISKGQLDAAVDSPLEWCAWVATDQLAQYFVHKTALSTAAQPSYGANLDFDTPVVVTKANLPPSGQLMPPTVDFSSYFTAKWDTEFSLNS